MKATTSWTSFISGFTAYLTLERGMSTHTISAYTSDIEKLQDWSNTAGISSPTAITYEDLLSFVTWLNGLGLGSKSQARIISGIRAFYRYLYLEDIIHDDPSELIKGPKLKRKIPEVLTYEEIEQLISAIDLSHPQGHRNRAMLETLYACGLRVSELISLQISSYFAADGIVRVIGKNNKERIVPIGSSAQKYLDYYLHYDRNQLSQIDSASTDIIFLNRRGRKLSRVMVFSIIKELVQKAGLNKNVSPHTFRHSFATHLVEGGANLRAVQDLLGHESITTTEIYTHLDTQYLRETIMQYHPRSRPR
ncbi:MAG: site-specific tyrosine recombinase XerD [Bacteroidota bacterium]